MDCHGYTALRIERFFGFLVLNELYLLLVSWFVSMSSGEGTYTPEEAFSANITDVWIAFQTFSK